MTAEPSVFDADALRTTCTITPWAGPAWRFHKRIWPADDPTGSLRKAGRWHFDWPVLYLALRSHVALGESMRHTVSDGLPTLRDQFRLTEFSVVLQSVAFVCSDNHCSDSALAGFPVEVMCRDDDFDNPDLTSTQRLSAAALRLGVEALLVPSCTRFADGNLVIFVSQLRPGSVVRIVRSEDPTLYVERQER